MSNIQNNNIKLLPEHIIDQIKAGEVIERPATLIKELLENSIDAGSKNITIHIINNGMDLIAVEDDGKGIAFDELPLAFCRHATSKIANFEDIYNLYTYGFRGEALASMASISKITCNSTQNGRSGIFKINGAQVISHQEDQGNKNGTSIYIKDLFYNTPVRLKFIQSKASEKNQIKKILNAFLLTHPEISFSIKWDDQDKEYYPSVGPKDLEKRILKMFFKKSNCSFFKTESEYDGVRFECLLSKESSKGNAGKHHYLFINKRFVQDVQIHKIILNSASSAWPFNESGHYFAFIDLPSDQLDVNVHPNKTVVKLFRPSQVFSQISSSIKKEVTPQRDFSNTTAFEGSEQGKSFSFKNSDFFSNDKKSQEQKIQELSHKDFQYRSSYLPNEELNFNSLKNDDDFEIIFKNKQYALISCENFDTPLILNLKNLGWFNFKRLISQKGSSIPLLVSEPLRDVSNNSVHIISELNDIGFEIDKLDKSTFIIRAFPNGLDGIYYLDYLNQILIDKNEFKNLNLFKRIDYYMQKNIEIEHHLDSFRIKSILNESALSLLIEVGVIVNLDKHKLDKYFYE